MVILCFLKEIILCKIILIVLISIIDLLQVAVYLKMNNVLSENTLSKSCNNFSASVVTY